MFAVSNVVLQQQPATVAVTKYGKWSIVFAVIVTVVSAVLFWPAAICSGLGIFLAATVCLLIVSFVT